MPRFASKIILLLLFVLFTLFEKSSAQSPDIKSANIQITLVKYLQIVEKKFEVSFSYNHSLLDQLVLIKNSNSNTLDIILDNISKQLSIKFENNNSNNYLVIPIRSTVSFGVIDSETKEPLISLNVILNNHNEFYLLPKASKFNIPNLFLTDTLLIGSRFYTNQKISADALAQLTEPMQLNPDTLYLNEVIVEDYLTKGIDSKLSDHSIQVNMKDLGSLAGETDGDILTLLRAIPGIRTPDGKPGSLNFRGTTFDQTLIYFDDIPIYHSGHFFGTISPYNSAIVNNVEIHRGVLPAKWGGRVGGLINLKTSNNIADSANYGLQVNTIYTGLKIKTPIVKGKLGAFISGRFNYPMESLSPKLQEFSDLNFQGSKIDPNVLDGQSNKLLNDFDVRFRDINGKLVYQINDDHKSTLSFMNIQNDFLYNFNSQDQSLIEIQTSTLDNWGITGKWEGTISNKAKTQLSITQSALKIIERNTESINDTVQKFDETANTINDFRLNANLNYQLNQTSSTELGYNLTDLNVKLDEANNDGRPTKHLNDFAQIHSFYFSLEKNWGTRLISNFGVHSDYYSELNKTYVDPRFSLSYMLNNFIFLKGSGGRSHQFIKQQFKDDFNDFRLQNQFWELTDNQSPVLEGYQGMMGFIYDRSNWIFDVEFYKKKSQGITSQISPGMDENGTLSSKGVDIFMKRTWSNVESWISYSLSKTETKFNQINEAHFNQTHIINLTNMIYLDRWSVALSWNYSSGMPVVLPVLDPNHSNSNGQTTLSIPYSENFPSQHQADLSVTYKFWKTANHWKGVIGLSFLNLYDQKNIINVYQNDPRVESPFRHAIGFAPNLNMSLNL